MSKNKNKHAHKNEQANEAVENPAAISKKVKMVFSEDKFYNDRENPLFIKGEIYGLEGQDWIERWIKRGGAIVDENTGLPKPMDSDKEEKVEETNSEEVKEEAETA